MWEGPVIPVTAAGFIVPSSEFPSFQFFQRKPTLTFLHCKSHCTLFGNSYDK